jgi:5-methylcytosine-specific restriction endonuclease McrA
MTMSDNLGMGPEADWLDAAYIQGMANRMLANALDKDTNKGVSWPEGGRPKHTAAEYAKKIVRHLTRYLILADNGMSNNQVLELIEDEAIEAESTLNEVTPEPPNDHLVAVGCNAMCLHRIDRLEGEKAKPEPLRKTKLLACPKCGDSPIAKTGPLDYRCANPDCNARLRQDPETVRVVEEADPMKFWTDNNGVPFCPQCGKARPAHLPKCRDCIVDELVDLLKVPSVVQPVVGTCQTCGAGKVFRAKKCFRCYAEGLWKSIRSAWRP